MHLSRLHALALMLGLWAQLAFGQDVPGLTQTFTVTSDSIVYVVETIFETVVEPTATAEVTETLVEPISASTPINGVGGIPLTSSTALIPTTSALSSIRRSSAIPRSSSSRASQTAVPASSDSSGSSNTGAIAGGVVGGVAALGVGTALLLLRNRRRKKRAHSFTEELGRAAGYSPGVEKEGIQHREEETGGDLSGHTMMMRRE